MRHVRLTLCQRFRPSPYPTNYGGRWATMPSADFCPITSCVSTSRAAHVTVGFDGDSSTFALALSSTPMVAQTASGAAFSATHPHFAEKPSYGILPARLKRCFSPPNKSMNFSCTTAAFTLPPAPGGLCHLVLTCPGARPSMRFLSVGSHVCARASFRHPLAGLPLRSASS